MSPDEAKAYGIIDEVYSAPDQSLISEAIARGALGGEGPAESPEERDRDRNGPVGQGLQPLSTPRLAASDGERMRRRAKCGRRAEA